MNPAAIELPTVSATELAASLAEISAAVNTMRIPPVDLGTVPETQKDENPRNRDAH